MTTLLSSGPHRPAAVIEWAGGSQGGVGQSDACSDAQRQERCREQDAAQPTGGVFGLDGLAEQAAALADQRYSFGVGWGFGVRLVGRFMVMHAGKVPSRLVHAAAFRAWHPGAPGCPTPWGGIKFSARFRAWGVACWMPLPCPSPEPGGCAVHERDRPVSGLADNRDWVVRGEGMAFRPPRLAGHLFVPGRFAKSDDT